MSVAPKTATFWKPPSWRQTTGNGCSKLLALGLPLRNGTRMYFGDCVKRAAVSSSFVSMALVAGLESIALHLTVHVLDVVDVVVSKLKRFSPNDVSDIRAMTEKVW